MKLPPRSAALPPSPYDAEGTSESDLWFLPGPGDEAMDRVTRPPLPYADRRDLAEAGEWRAAQGTLAAELARSAMLFGALDERLSRLGEGARQRLALLEAAELSWHSGDRVPPDRLGLWVSLRLAGAQDDAQSLARAAWAVRRLAGGSGPMPDGPGAAERLAAFLGRQGTHAPGDDLYGRLQDWAEAISRAGDLHPFVRAAYAARLWTFAWISGPGSVGLIEAHVTVARLAAMAGRGGAVFLPLLLAGSQALRRDGTVEVQLQRFLQGAEQASLAALLHLDRLSAWRARAEAATVDLSGRTPPRLIKALSDWPLISTPMAERVAGCSRAAAQRNLDILWSRDLIREVTGQSHFRMWSAKL